MSGHRGARGSRPLESGHRTETERPGRPLSVVMISRRSLPLTPPSAARDLMSSPTQPGSRLLRVIGLTGYTTIGLAVLAFLVSR